MLFGRDKVLLFIPSLTLESQDNVKLLLIIKLLENSFYITHSYC